MNRFTPFTHRPGLPMLLPGTSYLVEAFPTLLKISTNDKSYHISFSLTGPIEGFTTLQNQEKDRIEIFGTAKEGFFLFYLQETNGSLRLILRRGVEVKGQIDGSPFSLTHKDSLEIARGLSLALKKQERLSFGCHKKLDFSKVENRFELQELLPLLFFLGQKYPFTKEVLPLKEEGEFKEVLQVYFNHLLVPEVEDKKFLGLTRKPLPKNTSKEEILSSIASSIRALFFKEAEEEIYLLPELWSSLPSGRFIGLETSWGEFAIDWTKHKLRRLHFTATKDGLLRIHWPKEILSYRLKRHLKEKGVIKESGEKLLVKAGTTYLLDRFEK
jgi:hypothetical protein